MVQKLEATKGGGESIRVGATGTIGSLMTRELESVKSTPQIPVSCRNETRTVAVSVPCTPRRLQAWKSLDEASNSGISNSVNRRSLETTRKMKSNVKIAHKVSMLASDITLDRTPGREKTSKRGTNLVEVVDISCGNPDTAWASPITSKLKKLGFSKLSESTV